MLVIDFVVILLEWARGVHGIRLVQWSLTECRRLLRQGLRHTLRCRDQETVLLKVPGQTAEKMEL